MIGTLTNDMIRLCGEIGALHESRVQGIQDLKQTVSEMRAGFRDAHAAMADQTKTNLRDFVANVQGAVTAFREELLGDIAGAHRAWRGGISRQGPARTAAAQEPMDAAPKAKRKKH
jgi:hypothetical protein